jgi:hypothetical protein
MHVLVAMDGSKYGYWGLNWVATKPFVTPPRVTALHVPGSGGHFGRAQRSCALKHDREEPSRRPSSSWRR